MSAERIGDLSQDIFESERKIQKARVLLSDLLENYEFDGKRPDEKLVTNMMIESAKIIRFIGIINDYICDAEKDLEQVQERIMFIIDAQET